MKKLTIAILLCLLMATAAHAKNKHPERWYQAQACPIIGGEMEVVLDDRTRIDCLTDEYAIEFDFGPKWAEALGQSLFYASKTGKRAGVILILEKPGDLRYKARIESAIEYHGLEVDVWVFEGWSE